MRILREAFVILFAFASSLGAVGCGPDTRGLCESIEECRGGNNADIDACVATHEYDAEAADIEGCTDEYEAYFECFFNAADCHSSDTGVACAGTAECAAKGFAICTDGTCRKKVYSVDDPDVCAAETSAYKNCQ
jgi:hypothetical protein